MISPAHCNLGILASLTATLLVGGWLGAQTQPAVTPVATQSATRPATSRAATQPARPEIEAAIARLASDDFKSRQTAQDELVQFGDDSVPRLQQLAAETKDPEVRARSEAALKLIEEARYVGQSLVTIHLRDVAPAVLFAEIARQGHTQFTTWPATLWKQRAWPTVTVDIDRQPFWTAMQEATTKVGVQLQQMGGPGHHLSLTQGNSNWMSGPSVHSGPFLVVARNITRTNSVDLSQPANIQRDFNISFYVFAEPKLRILQSTYEVKLESAVDDKGNSLAPGGPWSGGMSSGNNFPFNLSARLTYPANAGARIAKLKGAAVFVVQTRQETVEIPDILNVKNLTKTIAGRRLLIRNVRKNGEQYTVESTLYHDALSPQEWEQFRNPNGQALLVDAAGKPLASRGWGGGGSNTEMQMNLEFARDNSGGDEGRPGEPVKLIWEIPTEMKEISARFEFTDLPIPN